MQYLTKNETPSRRARSSSDDGQPDAKELALEQRYAEEDRVRRQWMHEPAGALAERIPTSVFALGDLAR